MFRERVKRELIARRQCQQLPSKAKCRDLGVLTLESIYASTMLGRHARTEQYYYYYGRTPKMQGKFTNSKSIKLLGSLQLVSIMYSRATRLSPSNYVYILQRHVVRNLTRSERRTESRPGHVPVQASSGTSRWVGRLTEESEDAKRNGRPVRFS